MTLSTMRFEFNPVHKILLARFEGRIADESLAESYATNQKYAIATDASVNIADYSSVTEIGVSTAFIRHLANRAPVLAEPTRPRFIVVPTSVGLGLARMFQILGEPTRPLLQVVHTLDEALAALGIQAPHFEPLVVPTPCPSHTVAQEVRKILLGVAVALLPSRGFRVPTQFFPQFDNRCLEA